MRNGALGKGEARYVEEYLLSVYNDGENALGTELLCTRLKQMHSNTTAPQKILPSLRFVVLSMLQRCFQYFVYPMYISKGRITPPSDLNTDSAQHL